MLIANILILSLSLSANSWYVGGGLGYRESVTTDMPLTVNMAAGYNDFDFDLRFQGIDHFDLSASYVTKKDSTFYGDFIFHTHYAYKEGGFSDLSALFNVSFDFLRYFSITGALGIQLGAAYSPYSRDLMWSLSPLVVLECGVDIEPVEVKVFLSFISENERSWKAVPVYGLELDVDINSNHSIRLSGWMKAAEYLMDNWTMITAYGGKLTYVYRGGSL